MCIYVHNSTKFRNIQAILLFLDAIKYYDQSVKILYGHADL